ncbi:MAG: hypothetical protein K0S07_792 [Chlamydiales bacterium]|jgi:hypothetical protein|nr:hypothetical protein [Chlamydiales bacterium]
MKTELFLPSQPPFQAESKDLSCKRGLKRKLSVESAAAQLIGRLQPFESAPKKLAPQRFEKKACRYPIWKIKKDREEGLGEGALREPLPSLHWKKRLLQQSLNDLRWNLQTVPLEILAKILSYAKGEQKGALNLPLRLVSLRWNEQYYAFNRKESLLIECPRDTPILEEAFSRYLDKLMLMPLLKGLNLNAASPLQLKKIMEHPLLTRMHWLKLDLNQAVHIEWDMTCERRWQVCRQKIEANWRQLRMFELATLAEGDKRKESAMYLENARLGSNCHQMEKNCHELTDHTFSSIQIQRQLPSLEELEICLSANHTPFVRQLLAKAPHLKRLSFFIDASSEELLLNEAFAAFPQTVSHLNLFQCDLGAKNYASIAERLAHLKQLILGGFSKRGDYLSIEGAELIYSKNQELEALDLSSNRAIDFSAFKEPLFPKLTNLTLRGMVFHHLQQLKDLKKHCPQLKALTLLKCSEALQEGQVQQYLPCYQPGSSVVSSFQGEIVALFPSVDLKMSHDEKRQFPLVL